MRETIYSTLQCFDNPRIKELADKIYSKSGSADDLVDGLRGETAEVLAQLLLSQTPDGMTLISFLVALESVESYHLAVLLQILRPEALGKAITIQNNMGETLLHCLYYRYPQDRWVGGIIELLIDKSNNEDLDQAITIKQGNGETPLSLSLGTWEGKSKYSCSKKLIAKVTSNALNDALVIANDHGIDLLWCAATHLEADDFQAFIKKVSAATLSDALGIGTGKTGFALSAAARSQNHAAFLALTTKVSAEALGAALLVRDCEGRTAWHEVAFFQKGPAFQVLVHQVSANVLSEALVIQNAEGETLFLLASYKQESAALQALIAKVSVDALQAAAVIKGHDGFTPLLFIAYRRDHVVFQQLIEKMPADALRLGMRDQDPQGHTFLHFAAEFLPGESFLALMDKIGFEALAVENQQGNTPMDCAILNADYRVFEMLATTLSPLQLHRALLKYYKSNRYWGEGAWLADLRRRVLEAAVEEESVVRVHLDSMAVEAMLAGANDGAEQTLQLGNGEYICLADENFQDRLKQEGVYAWKDLYTLKIWGVKSEPNEALSSLMMSMMDHDRRAPVFPIRVEANVVLMSEVEAALAAGNLAMKNFSGWQPGAWRDFIRQLKDPTWRPSLRDPEKQVGPTLFKFFHMEGEVRKYKKGSRIKPHHSTHAKKQSATLISPDKVTPLFQSVASKGVIAGVALRVDTNLDHSEASYDPKKAKLRALLLTDTGTYARQWVDFSEYRLQHYADRYRNFTSLEAFKSVVKTADKMNEIFVQPSRESLLAIVLGRDNAASREKALQYQKDIEEALGITLPIVRYDPHRRLLERFEDVENKQDSALSFFVGTRMGDKSESEAPVTTLSKNQRTTCTIS